MGKEVVRSFILGIMFTLFIGAIAFIAGGYTIEKLPHPPGNGINIE